MDLRYDFTNVTLCGLKNVQDLNKIIYGSVEIKNEKCKFELVKMDCKTRLWTE